MIVGRTRARFATLAAFALGTSTVLVAHVDDSPRKPAMAVRYDRDIRPILANNCYACHGPDANQRKAKLRLDLRDEALAAREDGGAALVPGDVEKSLLYERISAADVDDRMPPQKTGKKLTADQIAKVRAWIEQGAPYTKHWSFEPPVRSPRPETSNPSWSRNAIDDFVLARLDAEKLTPSPEATKETLLRRVTLALTGLPPTIAEIDAFLADTSVDAYERVVDRLLASPRYGEHMARSWLDAARYADTHGFHFDNERSLWPWRDWVIRAFNQNERFDQFTIDQLAGDLLPNPTRDQRIATGFERNNPTSNEGGLINEEYLAKYAMDRVDTMSTVWMGLTMGCAKCHDHKFDPVTQEEYYRMYSFFDDTEGAAMDGNIPVPEPALKVPTPEDEAKLAAATAEVDALKTKLDAPLPEVDARQAQWESDVSQRLAQQWSRPRVLAAKARSAATIRTLDDGSLLVEGESPKTDAYDVELAAASKPITGVMLELITNDANTNGVGRAFNGNFVLGDFKVLAGEREVAWASAQADHEQEGFPVANAIDARPDTGWAILKKEKENHLALFLPAQPIRLEPGEKLHVHLGFDTGYEQHTLAHFRIALATDPQLQPLVLGPWSSAGPFAAESGKIAFDTEFPPEKQDTGEKDAKVDWTAQPEYGDGVANKFTGDNSAMYVTRTITAPTARHVELAIGSDDALKVWLDGKLVHSNEVARALKIGEDKLGLDLDAGEHRVMLKIVNYLGDFSFSFEKRADEVAGAPLAIVRTLEIPAASRTDANKTELRGHFRSRHSAEWKALSEQLTAKVEEQKQVDASIAQTMVMTEKAMPAETHILMRGQYDHPGAAVTSGVPASLPPLPEGAPVNRLGLAQWLVSPAHPLTARVFVNRLWQLDFGRGIVKTAEDFGAQGEWPTHPELLDWLAVEFVESGWDVKHIQKLIVTSATFRQSSRIGRELHERDPDNQLLARGPRVRLEAEVIRDCALAIGGLLVEDIGGKSVKPYQPGNLWKVGSFIGSTTENFVQDTGPGLYRRSMYTFWKRTSPPANLAVFDAPSREVCCVRRERTNTPMQALVLLNDTQFVEAARSFAQRMMLEGGHGVRERAAYGFRLATGRAPTEKEIGELEALYRDELEHFRGDIQGSFDLTEIGESKAKPELDVCEHAAWTIVASALLNLDETVNLN